MPSLFCVVGLRDAPDQRAIVWPVAYRLVEEEAKALVTICEEQRDVFMKAIEPVLNLIEIHKYNRPRRSRISSVSFDRAMDKWNTEHRSLLLREAEINMKYASDMLDPLFPTSTNGKMPGEIVYKVLPFWDDPREMGLAALMKARAMLHGIDSERDEERVDDDD